jgi:hypothetical protein
VDQIVDSNGHDDESTPLKTGCHFGENKHVCQTLERMHNYNLLPFLKCGSNQVGIPRQFLLFQVSGSTTILF